MDRKLIQEINRLFDELVHHPWSRVPASRVPNLPLPQVSQPPAELVIEIPLADAELGSVGVEVEGRRVTVVVTTRASRRGTDEHFGESAAVRETRQTFEVPEGMQAAGFEARFDGDTLRVRIGLRAYGKSENLG
jgi:HSP20 family molecular chaperone IbpA